MSDAVSDFPWGAATGVGSLPGGDAREAAKTVTGSLIGADGSAA